jgi:hypothetical protein
MPALCKVSLHVIGIVVAPVLLTGAALFLVRRIVVEFPLVVVRAASTLAIGGAADSLVRMEARR